MPAVKTKKVVNKEIAKLKKHDFVEIEYTGRLEDDTIFDTTDEKTAQDAGIAKEGTKFEPTVICLGENHILKGEIDSLVDAAGCAYKDAAKDIESESENKSIVFIDCISRVLFLEDDFDEELNAVYKEGLPMIGALTLGEIANSGKDYLEFYNKTAVVSIIENL